VSCYFRHLQRLFEEANIAVNPDNKNQIDQTIHQIMGTIYKDCPATWKALKPVLADAEKRSELIRTLHAAGF
jgi:hypothetical protein